MQGRHILVVDDNPDARETLAEALQIAGYDVRTAEDGRLALEMAVRRRPALVLLDLMMPVMDGWQVVEAMRVDPGLASIPVVIVSAATSAPPAGLPVIHKPASFEEVLDVVRRALSSAETDTS